LNFEFLYGRIVSLSQQRPNFRHAMSFKEHPLNANSGSGVFSGIIEFLFGYIPAPLFSFTRFINSSPPELQFQ
jgi:hypothetical protein